MDDGDQNVNDASDLAPVIPLFGPRSGAPEPPRTPHARGGSPVAGSGAEPVTGSWHVTWTDDVERSELDVDTASAREAAEKVLLKKLRTRSLSEREARAVLRSEGLDDPVIDAVVEGLLRHGYLDDLRLAEHLVYIGSDRKRQGRQAIARTLASRGIPREVVDAVLSETHDDDAARALEFARLKARSLHTLERDVALRRLVGQLSRRGYPGTVAMTAARAALDEAGSATSSVRFE